MQTTQNEYEGELRLQTSSTYYEIKSTTSKANNETHVNNTLWNAEATERVKHTQSTTSETSTEDNTVNETQSTTQAVSEEEQDGTDEEWYDAHASEEG